MEKTPENNPVSSMEKTPENNPVSSKNHLLAHVTSTGRNQIPPENLAGNIVQYSHNIYKELDDDSYFASFPDGWIFRPEDDQLICEYLIPKLNNAKLERNRFHEVDFIDFTPMQLTETYQSQGENQWFFFTERDRRYLNGKRPKRATDQGVWQATDVVQPVTRNGIQVGSKTTLVYYYYTDNDSECKKKDSEREKVKTPWMMHEYVVTDSSRPPNGIDTKLDDCVLCKIYKSPRANKKDAKDQDDQDPIDQDVQDPGHQDDQDLYQNQFQFQQVRNGEKDSEEQNSPLFTKSSLIVTPNPNNNHIQGENHFFNEVPQRSFVTSSPSIFNTGRTCHVSESMTVRQTSNVPSGSVKDPCTSNKNQNYHIPNLSQNSHPNNIPDDIRLDPITYKTWDNVGTSYGSDHVDLGNSNIGYPSVSMMEQYPSSRNENYNIPNSLQNSGLKYTPGDVRSSPFTYSAQHNVGTSYEYDHVDLGKPNDDYLSVPMIEQFHRSRNQYYHILNSSPNSNQNPISHDIIPNNVYQPAPTTKPSTSTYGSFPCILDHNTAAGPFEQAPQLTITEQDPMFRVLEELGLTVEDCNFLDSLIVDNCSIPWPEPLPEVGGA